MDEAEWSLSKFTCAQCIGRGAVGKEGSASPHFHLLHLARLLFHQATHPKTHLPKNPPTYSATQPNLKMQLHQTQPQTHPTAHGTALPNKAKFSGHRIKSQLSSQLISICGPLHSVQCTPSHLSTKLKTALKFTTELKNRNSPLN